MSKLLSAGIIILNPEREIFLAHVTGQPQWDIPKGQLDPLEDPVQAALRETFEETGLSFRKDEIVDLGRRPYTPRKDLHFFYTVVDKASIDLAACRCESYFTHAVTGQPTPEMDAFQWVALTDVPRYCSTLMARLLTGQDLEQRITRWPAAALVRATQDRGARRA